MTKKELDLLESAFSAEVDSAMSGGPPILQTKSEVAEGLVKDGLLEKRQAYLLGWFPVVIEGYQLTHAGRLAYCESCKESGDE